MDFYFPGSQDFVDELFNFDREDRPEVESRQRDRRFVYPHNVFSKPPYDGFLVSMSVVESDHRLAKYTFGQAARLRAEKVQTFFRLPQAERLKTMGDCGAFGYRKRRAPPYTPDEAAGFYQDCGFDYGLSVDHLVPGYCEGFGDVSSEWRERYDMTLQLASEFWQSHRALGCTFEPVGVAQGWSPETYAEAIRELQLIGYRYIAIGGLAALRTCEIVKCLEKIATVRLPSTRLHLLGVTRFEVGTRLEALGVVSFDSTTPFREAVSRNPDNYWTVERNYIALRVPNPDKSRKVLARIRSGRIDALKARHLSRACLGTLKAYDAGEASVTETLRAVMEYEHFYDDGVVDRSERYREVLERRPWKECGCPICNEIGIDVVIFRGSERNRRRGFHNLQVFYTALRQEVANTVALFPIPATERVCHMAAYSERTIIMSKDSVLTLPALEIQQTHKRKLYSFAVDGKLLREFAAVSRIRRTNGNALIGYQRPEVVAHIEEIRKYLESADPLLPNAIVIAFDQTVQFVPNEAECSPSARFGTLEIPIRMGQADSEKPGLIVDGQQRSAAIRDSDLDSFPICATAFIAADEKEQREQFMLVNSTKPLSKSLLLELLPETDGKLPSQLQRYKFPSILLRRLNFDSDSPLRGKVRTETNPLGILQDFGVLNMLGNSLRDGVLYWYRDLLSGETDLESMVAVLKNFWTAVARSFPEAWDLPPQKSRLTHGAGVIGMGRLMDTISNRYREAGVPQEDMFRQDLLPLRPVCRWTEGYWEFGPGDRRKWNELQNTSRDILTLSRYLIVNYRTLVCSCG